MSKINVGIAGFGLSGKVFHYPLLADHSGFNITTVQTSQADTVRTLLPTAQLVKTIDELCQAPVDLIVVGVPNFLHFEFAAKALHAGKHVVVEKPFTVTSVEASQLLTLRDKSQKTLTVFQNRRWDADFQTIQAIQKSGQLGEIVHYEAHFDRFKPEVDQRWKELPHPGGGIMYDLGAHLIDQALVLFGNPNRVFADVSNQRTGASQDDYFHIILDFGRTRAILHASALVAAQGPRFTIHGTRGSFVKSGMDPQEDQLKGGMSPKADLFGREAVENYGTLTLMDQGKRQARRIPSERGNYAAFYNGVAKAVTEGAPVPVDPTDAIKVIRTIELAKESSANGSWVSW